MVIRYAVTMADGVSSEVGIRDLKAHLSDHVNRVIYRDETVWVTKNGKRVAALVPAAWAEQMLADRERAATPES